MTNEIKSKIMKIVEKLNKSNGAVSFSVFLTEYRLSIQNKDSVDDLRENLKDTSLSQDEIIAIEEILVRCNLSSTVFETFLNLVRLTKNKISEGSLSELCQKCLNQEINDQSILGVCVYMGFIYKNEYCDFFEYIINILRNKESYVVGEVAYNAAKMGCTNCKKAIEKILSIEDKNPVMIDFTNQALEILNT